MSAVGVCVVEIQEAEEGQPCQHVLSPGTYTVGSASDCDLPARASGVSRRHLELEVLPDGGVLLHDLGSRNGTFFGKRKISRLALSEPLRFRLGRACITVHPNTDAIHVVPLPGVEASAFPEPMSLTASQLTDLPGTTWQLLNDTESILAAGGILADSMPRLLGQWCARLDVDALILRRAAGAEILWAAGLPDTPAATSHDTIDIPGLCLELQQQGSARPITPEQRVALRISLAAVAGQLDRTPHKPQASVSPATADDLSRACVTPGMRSLYELADRLSRGDIAVLIRGESGVGKELLARWIHQRSARSAGSFLAINCAALPADLLETEIFGIERGVATGVEAREGLLERARGGTLFLDEIGDMAPATQAKMLRALESNTIYRVGGSRPVPLDVRFVAATHQDLPQRIAAGEFRLDLYHRVAAVELTVPPLRERREDIAQLATRFLAEELARLDRPIAGITDAALAALCEHDWPGNVRELRNEMVRAALLLRPHQALQVAALSPDLVPTADAADLSLASTLKRAEQRAFAVAQAAAGGDHAVAMRLLKLPRSSYFRRLRQLRDDDKQGGAS